MDVYCMDCKNYTRLYPVGYVCRLDIFKNEIGHYCVPSEFTCKKRNREKDCKDFTPKLFKKRKYK